MKLEAGKYYKTRDGRKAFVFGQDPMKADANICCFVVCLSGVDVYYNYIENGMYYSNYPETGMDLIAEWREPVKVEGWVAVGPTDELSYSLHKDRDWMLKNYPTWTIIRVRGMEGKE